MFTQRFVPRGPQKTLIKYEVYRNKHASDEDFELIDSMYKRIMSEDKALCEAAQSNINIGVFTNGELHPKLEKGPLFFQGLVRKAVIDHHKYEQEVGYEIWPAQPKKSKSLTEAVSDRDLAFCAGLACSSRAELVF